MYHRIYHIATVQNAEIQNGVDAPMPRSYGYSRARAGRREPDRMRPRRRSDRGEGVISTAIAVLIMAFLGAAMWVAFNTIWDNAEDDIKDQMEIIGDSGSP